MDELEDLLNQWSALAAPAADEAAAFSITLPDGGRTISARLSPLKKRFRFLVQPAFMTPKLCAETGNRFWILVFPELTARDTEPLAFQTARVLRRLFGADSARPVLIDSLVGEAYISSDELTFSGNCESDNGGPAKHGWALVGHGMLHAWDKTKGAGVTVASIDTGYSNHRELAGAIEMDGQLNLLETDTPSDARDRFSVGWLRHPGHGTLVASVVASRGTVSQDGATDDDDKRVTGAAPEARVLPIRVTRSVIDTRQKHLPAAIEHAVNRGCDVIVFALGGLTPIEPVEAAMRYAVANGVVIVCAAGNCIGSVVFPAQFAKQGLAAAIAAVDFQYNPWEKTSKGSAVTVSAFGEAVWGARKRKEDESDEGVEAQQGTTLAASLTAGAAALWVAAKRGRARLKAIADRNGVSVQTLFNEALRATAHRPSGWPSTGMGAGVLNAGALVNTRVREISNRLLPQTKVAITHVTPLRRLLADAVAEINPMAAFEAASLDEDLAAEALWRFHVSRARERAAAMSKQSREPLATTPALASALSSRPRLEALLT